MNERQPPFLISTGSHPALALQRLDEVAYAINRQYTGVASPSSPLPDIFATGGVSCQRFSVNSIHANYVLVYPFKPDGTVDSGATSILVSRGFLNSSLNSWNGLTFTYSDPQTRVANNGTTTENQKLIPNYVVGDQIWALNQITSGTGVTESSDPTSAAVTWQDINVDSRCWCQSS